MNSPYKGHAMEAVALKSTLIERGLLSCHDDAAGCLMQAVERAYRAGRDAGLGAAAEVCDAEAGTVVSGSLYLAARKIRNMKGGDEG